MKEICLLLLALFGVAICAGSPADQVDQNGPVDAHVPFAFPNTRPPPSVQIPGAKVLMMLAIANLLILQTKCYLKRRGKRGSFFALLRLSFTQNPLEFVSEKLNFSSMIYKWIHFSCSIHYSHIS
ncbi:hypothetical protein Ciccas_003753 [Cichlidogyrus casuarinus]|uniref:Uncharacterized protein n=1 Tax=Cichlidogyrus casuarinus TaxID=1844966 RepID=A0ABD2QDG5_9PLAT